MTGPASKVTTVPLGGTRWRVHDLGLACCALEYAAATLRPDLPAHRWRPVLRHHFTDSFPPAHPHTEES